MAGMRHKPATQNCLSRKHATVMRALTLFTFLALLITGFGLATSAPALAHDHKSGKIVEDPEAVERALTRQACGGDPDYEPSFQRWVDLTGDGNQDVIFDHGGAACMGSVSYFCGSGGCSGSVYIALGDGRFKRTHFPPQVHAIEWRGEPSVRVFYHGSYCGRPGVDGCEEVWTWQGKTFVKRWQNY